MRALVSVKQASRIVLTVCAIALFVTPVSASPIRPDIKKILAQPPAPEPQYIPARAGWNGPEIATAKASPNPTYESLSPVKAAIAVRTSLIGAAIPDLRILALIVLVILLLRRMRRPRELAPLPAPAGVAPIVPAPSLTPEKTDDTLPGAA